MNSIVPNVVTRQSAADAAGLSEHQRKTALRVANIPKKEFEELVESDDPPTIEQLAERGKRKRETPEVIDYLSGRDPRDFEQATHLIGAFQFIDNTARPIDLAAASRGLNDRERQSIRLSVQRAREWLREVSDAV